MTKRPLNACRDCGYTWYPRGKNLSYVCPRCGSYETATGTQLAMEGLFEFIGQVAKLVYYVIYGVLYGLWMTLLCFDRGVVAFFRWLIDLDPDRPGAFVGKLLLITAILIGFVLGGILLVQHLLALQRVRSSR